MSSVVINSLGLCFDIVGASLVFWFGLPAQISREGHQAILLEGQDDNMIRKAKAYDFRARAGLLLMAIGFVLQLVSIKGQGLSPMDIEAEKAQVRDCLDQLWVALRQSDPRAIAALYHPNANLVLRGEEVAVGRPAIERQSAELLALDPVRPGTSLTSRLRIHLVRPEVAIVDVASRLTRADACGDPQESGDVSFTIVAVKDEGGWRLAAVRGADSSNISPP